MRRNVVLVLLAISLSISLAANIVFMAKPSPDIKELSEKIKEDVIIQINRRSQNDREREDSATIKELAEQGRQIVSGIFELKSPGQYKTYLIELRTDNSCISWDYQKGLPNLKQHIRNTTWKMGDLNVIETGMGKFKIEREDMVDEKGNRWFRVR